MDLKETQGFLSSSLEILAFLASTEGPISTSVGQNLEAITEICQNTNEQGLAKLLKSASFSSTVYV